MLSGDYDELLRPPRAEDERRAAPLLGHRLRRRGVTGVSRWSVTDGVVRASVHEGTNEEALRAAAAPLVVEIEWMPPVGWDRIGSPGGPLLLDADGARFADEGTKSVAAAASPLPTP